MLAFTSTIELCTGNSGQRNQTRKRKPSNLFADDMKP
jgi:hypothetical protein